MNPAQNSYNRSILKVIGYFLYSRLRRMPNILLLRHNLLHSGWGFVKSDGAGANWLGTHTFIPNNKNIIAKIFG
jgi:hypothetical protein